MTICNMTLLKQLLYPEIYIWQRFRFNYITLMSQSSSNLFSTFPLPNLSSFPSSSSSAILRLEIIHWALSQVNYNIPVSFFICFFICIYKKVFSKNILCKEYEHKKKSKLHYAPVRITLKSCLKFDSECFFTPWIKIILFEELGSLKWRHHVRLLVSSIPLITLQ